MKDLEEEDQDADLCIGSLDVKALYPSLKIKECARICREEVMKSEVVFEGVDYRWATQYLALSYTHAEINARRLNTVVPVRRYKFGQRPTISRIMDDEKGERWRWCKNPDKYNPTEKRLIMAHVVETMVIATFNDHFYRWDGRVMH